MLCQSTHHSALIGYLPFPTANSQLHRYVLDQILSGEATEDVVENIHEYLTTLGQSIRSGSVKVDDFIIFKVRRRLDVQTHYTDFRISVLVKILRITRMLKVNPMYK